MIIHLDTNIFRADFRMRGSAFHTFLDSLKRIGAKCVVSEIVRDEVLSLFQRELEKSATEIERAHASWLQLTGQQLSAKPSAEDLAKAVSAYCKFFDKTLKDFEIKLLPYPEISHKSLVERATRRRKPFKESGSGYRDSLIWETLLSQRRACGEVIVFITNNSKDFGNAPDLHEDLLAEIEQGKSIDLYNTLQDFNASQIMPKLEHLDTLLYEIQEDRCEKFDLAAWIDSHIQDEINRNDDACSFVGLEYDHAHVWVSKIYESRDLFVDDVRALPSGDLLVSANVDLTMEVSVSADSDDCYRYSDLREFFGGGDCSGDPMTSVKKSGNIAFTLTLKRESFAVDWCTIDEIAGESWTTFNPHKRREIDAEP